MAQEPIVKDVKTNRIIHMEKGQTAHEAACLMREKNISSVIVLDKNTIAGIITERDIVHKIVCPDLNPHQTLLETIMSKPVHTVDVNQTIIEAARKMRELKIKKLVVTEGQEVKGIISERDILEVDPALHTNH